MRKEAEKFGFGGGDVNKYRFIKNQRQRVTKGA
jgi:hypothetical protein